MTQELAVIEDNRNTALMTLVGRPSDIVRNWKEFEQLKKDLLSDDDYQTLTQDGKSVKFIKKAGWRKIASAFGVSLETIKEERIEISPTQFAIQYIVRAIGPGSGRWSDGVGMCDNQESRFRRGTYKIHDIYSTAYTRAANRAISDLVGGGEVSAEEVSSTDKESGKELNTNLQNRLLELANALGTTGPTLLAELVFEQLGSRHLSVEQATTIANKLKAKAAGTATNQNPAQSQPQVTEGQVRELTPPSQGAPRTAPATPPVKDPKRTAPAQSANVAPAAARPAPAPATAPVTEKDERADRAFQIEMLTGGLKTLTNDGSTWAKTLPEDYEDAVKALTGGLGPVEVAEALGVDKLTVAAAQHYKLPKTLTTEQLLSAALHLVLEWVEMRNATANKANQQAAAVAGGQHNDQDFAQATDDEDWFGSISEQN